jgi:hypothetical protein
MENTNEYPTYTAYPSPNITSISPNSGYINESKKVLINGANYFSSPNANLKVFFNNKEIQIQTNSDLQIEIKVPTWSSAQKVPILIQSVGGISNTLYYEYKNIAPKCPYSSDKYPNCYHDSVGFLVKVIRVITPYKSKTIYIEKKKVLKVPFTVLSNVNLSGKVHIKIYKKNVLSTKVTSQSIKTNSTQFFLLKGKKANKSTKVKIIVGTRTITFNVKVTKGSKKLNKIKIKASSKKLSVKAYKTSKKLYLISVALLPKKSTNVKLSFSIKGKYKKYLSINKKDGRITPKKYSKKKVIVTVKANGIKKTIKIKVKK